MIDDDVNLTVHVRDWLVEVEKHSLEIAHTAEDGWQLLSQFAYEVVVLDWQLPAMSGVELCRKVRANEIPVLILFLTGQGTTENLEEGLGAGADDYLKKPFEVRELAARVKALLRRSGPVSNLAFSKLSVALEPEKRALSIGDESVRLSKLECAFLEFLMRRPDAVFSAADILKNVYPSEKNSSEEAVRVMVKGLRTKLGQMKNSQRATSLIKTIPGLGYSFSLSTDENRGNEN